MDKERIRLIDELKKFKKENDISKIVFFGSRGSSNYNKYSDVDLIIVSSEFRKLKSFKRAPTIRLKWKLDYSVDMFCYTPEEFEERKKGPTVVREAVRTGIEI